MGQAPARSEQRAGEAVLTGAGRGPAGSSWSSAARAEGCSHHCAAGEGSACDDPGTFCFQNAAVGSKPGTS